MAFLRLHEKVRGFRRVGQLRFDFHDPVPTGEQKLVDKQFEERGPVLVVDSGAKTGDLSIAAVGG